MRKNTKTIKIVINDTDKAIVHLLDAAKVKRVILREDKGVCDSSIYAELGSMADYETVTAPSEHKVTLGDLLRESVIGYGRTPMPFGSPETSTVDTLYAVVCPTDENRPYVDFGILTNGQMYVGGGHLITLRLAKSLHANNAKISKDFFDTYDKFTEFVMNIVKERDLRPAIEETCGTEKDEFFNDDFHEKTYVQLRKPKGQPISKDNVIIIASEPWNNAVKI